MNVGTATTMIAPPDIKPALKRVLINLESCAWAHLKYNLKCHIMERFHVVDFAKSVFDMTEKIF